MSTPIVRVFVSSTWLDLQPERAAVEKVLHRLEETKFVGMEYFGSRDETTQQASLDDVDKSDVYVGILGARYGSGITEEEYKRALDNDIPCFWYVMEGDSLNGFAIDDPEKRDAFKKSFSVNHLRDSFASPEELATNVAIDVNRWLRAGGLPRKGHQELLKGYVNGLPFDYAARIENFLNEYLGTPDHPVAFGGREAELGALTTWLDEDGQSPYLMLAAPAGRGKSALLVHWSRNLQKREDMEVVFVPISIRFRTNLSGVFFEAMAARLADLHGEKIKEKSTMTVEMWRGLITEYLGRPLPNGNRLLVIMDGLDEAADWQGGPDLFPNNPPKTLKIVASARFQVGDIDASQWLQRLGWEKNNLGKTQNLDLLSENGLRSVLESMGFPTAQLSERVDIVKEIYRLSEGDPLLVQLYSQELREEGKEAAHLEPEDLKDFEPGLKGYLDQWWMEQRAIWSEQKENPLKEKSVVALLDLFAFAAGPLYKDDIFSIIGKEYEIDNTYMLDEALRPLNRFVIGDGKDQGFVFSHPRLAYYFLDEKTPTESKRWEGLFIHWGKEAVRSFREGKIDSEDVSGYLIQYLGTHFERADAELEDWMLLVHKKWCDAWEALDGTNAGFLNDVSRVKKVTRNLSEQYIKRGDHSPYLGKMITCMLVEASIRTLNENIPDSLPVKLLENKIWTDNQILTYIDQLADEERKSNMLMSSMPLYSRERHGRIIDITKSIASDYYRSKTLVGIFPYLNKEMSAEALKEVLNAVLYITDVYRSGVLKDLAPHLEEEGLVLLLKASRAIESKYFRSLTLIGIGWCFNEEVQTEVLSEALESARSIAKKSTRTSALVDIAGHLSGELRNEILWESLELSRQIINDTDRTYALAGLTQNLNQEVFTKIINETLEAVRQISNQHHLAHALMKFVQLTSGEVRAEVLNETLEALLAIEDHSSRIRALESLTPHLSEQELLLALKAVQGIAQKDIRTNALVVLAPHLIGEMRTKVLREALKNSLEIESGHFRSSMLVSLAPHLSNLELTLAIQSAREIADDSSRSNALAGLSRYLNGEIHSKILREALESAYRIADDSLRSNVLASLASHLSGVMCTDVLRESIKSARVISDSSACVCALVSFAPYLSGEMRIETLKEAQESACVIVEENDRYNALVALVPYLSGEMRIEVLMEALESARAIEDRSSCARALASLATHLNREMHKAVLKEALETALTITDTFDRCRLLVDIVPYLSGMLRDDAIVEAHKAAQALTWDFTRTHALTELAPHLTGEMRSDLLKEALESGPESALGYDRTPVLVSLAPHLNEEQLVIALESVFSITDDIARSSSLVSLAPYLNGKGLLSALESARTIEKGYDRSLALLSLAPSLSGDLYIKVLNEAMTAAFSIEDNPDFAHALVSLAEYLRGEILVKVLKLVLETSPPLKIFTTYKWGDIPLKAFLFFPIEINLNVLDGICEILDSKYEKRSTVLQRIAKTSQYIKMLGGDESIKDIRQGIKEVTTWWP